MQILNEYLNVRNSTRKLTDSEFEKILPTLAEELVSVNYRIKYSEEKLRADWKKLLDYDNLVGGCKQLLDACSEEKLIWDDAPKYLDLKVEQHIGKKYETIIIREKA